jgi:mannose-6-phosphate isomerase-like protein (cupin superfamily)
MLVFYRLRKNDTRLRRGRSPFAPMKVVPAVSGLSMERKTFFTKVSASDVSGRYAIIEAHTPPSLGPELHIHPHQNELCIVLKGSIGVQCGSDRIVLRAGDTFMAPANVTHAFVALGTEPAYTLFLFDPAGDMERFFADYAPVFSVEGEPDHRKLAEANARHGIKVVGPPLAASSFSS